MKTILVIEDTPAMRENISEILQLAPYQVVQAANGREGIEQARQIHPDLILCDIKMPELDGFGVLHILRKDPTLAGIPFIFLTAKVEAADFRAGMNLGADDYLTKPFDDLTLLNAVELRLKKDAAVPPHPAEVSIPLGHLTKALLEGNDIRQFLCDYYPTTHYNRKHRLFTAGSRPTVVYFIQQGKGKLFQADAAGNEYITGLVGPGDFVGYRALLEEEPYTETAELLEEAQVCSIPKADLKTLLDHQSAVANQFFRMLAGDVAELQERLLKLAYQSVRKRVAEALLMVERKFYPQSEGRTTGDTVRSESLRFGHPDANTSSVMTLSRENWSHLVGASTETVIRILGDLRKEGLIEINASQITLLDIDKLTHLKR
ncbi:MULTISPECIES: response regulator [Spirosoma]|uniref:Response regulator n=1 Tax=Spirosoma liriopis TaxID=2937440 RepID=A0ABT0HVI2_9BACT|nr:MULTISPECIES: response regulator [Spirosoma]MCK8495608.1 response regulator [Spirosoma liriopis]UHG94544.1 response regulator [Spirosoma oryzicola]